MTLKRKFEKIVFRIPNIQIIYVNKIIPSSVREKIFNEDIEFVNSKYKEEYEQWLTMYQCKEDFKARVYCEAIAKYWEYIRKKHQHKNHDEMLEQIYIELKLERASKHVRLEIVTVLDRYWYYASKVDLNGILI